LITTTGQEALQFLNKVAEILPLGLFIYDVKEEEVVFLNRLAEVLIGEEKKQLYRPDGFFFTRLHPADRLAFTQFINRGLTEADGKQVEIEYRLKQNEQEWRWFFQRSIVFTRHEDGSPRLLLNLVEDISDRRQNEEALLRFSTALTMTSDSILITDLSNKILDANNAAIKMYGVTSKDQLVGQDWFNFIDPADKEYATEGMRTVLINGHLRGKELNIRPGRGDTMPVEVSISVITNARRAFVGLVIITRDISERKKNEAQLRYISSYDALTRLYNRFSYQEKINELENEDVSPVSVLMIDADGLKKINDTLGHLRGDDYLVRIADTLRHSFRQEDFIARIGGDEFVVILPGAGAGDMVNALERFRINIDKMNRSGESDLTISVSMGVATVENGQQVQKALFTADERMYTEKASKKSLVADRNDSNHNQ
jgi:diguanylate cyclase (GGDEF)-like protein/PAS domain S-box-containing protein